MRPVRGLVLLTVAASSLACERGCRSSNEATPAPSGSAAPAPAPSSASPSRPSALPALANTPCNPGPDSLTCTPDGLEVLTCAGGTWRLLESCRGPGHCKGAGANIACDPGEPQPGDACVAVRAEPHCRDAHHVLACTAGRWTESACGPGETCGPPRRRTDAAGPAGETVGQVGCK
jgi:hypothetical protein